MTTTWQYVGDRLVVDLGHEAGVTYFEDSLFAKLQRRRAEGVRVPGIADIRSDLSRMTGPVPARVSQGKQGKDDYLRLYVNGRYALVLSVSKYGHGYIIGDVYPLGLRDQDEIVRGEFALAAMSWRLYDHPRELPEYLDARWPAVKQAWHSRPKREGAKSPGDALPRAHQDYLDDLQLVIEKAREVELTGKPADRMCRYQRIAPAAAQRRTAQSIYKFQLMGDSRLVAGTKVHIDEHPGLRGEIKEIRESLVIVKFDQPVDFNHIPALGAFVASPNTTSLDKQAEAVEVLRDRRSRNPRLLDVLVDHRFQPFQPSTAIPRDMLDPSQQAAFRKALAVPDLALVQGPPGTGKTWTIKQVVREIVATRTGGGPVLVSAYTNQAVDNVLKDLGKDDLTVVRVGSGVTPDCAHLTLEAQATDLQQRILDRTEPQLSRYALADPDTGSAVQRMIELKAERARLEDAIARERQAREEFQRHDAQLTAPLRLRLEELDAALGSRKALAAEREQLAAKAAARQERAARRASMPVLGFLVKSRADRLAAAAGEAWTMAAQAASDVASAQDLRIKAQSDLARVRATDHKLAGYRARLAECGNIKARHAERSVASARRLAACLGDTAVLPPVPADLADLSRFVDVAGQAVALAQRRLLALRKWRAALERRTEQLYPELIRYADVVGATCIGAASSKYLGNMSFGLAIIDEAGQVAAPNLLVPLVRAERAVLVGDHLQLPPFAEQELADWARAENPTVADLVTKSAFELLFPYAPEGSRQMLNIQRRMPRVIGDFISGQFYGGSLDSDTNRPDRDELFAAPLAFVDTAELPAAGRRERRPRPGEPWPDKSWVNDAEAELIADLAAHYDARKSDWVVIVPFSAQAGRVSALLVKRLGDEELAASRVASVDSFQGGEHDTVIFGFTRSNSHASVGFFNDVRRSNVAFSRARQRLIMVGDMTTLVNASDTGFRAMMTALHDHLRQRGDLRGYRDVSALLGREAGR
jgi:AAA domain